MPAKPRQHRDRDRALRARGLCARRARHPAAGRAVPRSLGRGHPPPHLPDAGCRSAANCACGPNTPSRCRAPIWHRLTARPSRRAIAMLGPVFRTRSGEPGEFLQAGHRILRPRRHGGDRRRDAGAGLEATPRYGLQAPRHRHGRRRAVRGLVAALDLAPAWKRAPGQGLQPEGSLAHESRSTGADADANGAPEYRACSRRSPGRIPRPRALRRRICSRSPASPRSAAAPPARSPSASSSRRRSAPARTWPTRDAAALIERVPRHRGRSRRRRRPRCARSPPIGHARSRRRRSTCSRAHRLPRRARRRCRRASTSRPRFARNLDYYTGFIFELHDPGRGERPAGRRRPLRRPARPRLGAATPIPAVGFAVWLERLSASGGQPHDDAPLVLAVPSKGRLQENADRVLRPRRPEARQAARRARLSRHASPASPASRSPILSAVRDRRAARHGRRPSRHHRRGSGAREDRRCRRGGRDADAARLRPRQCRRRGAAGLDRRAQHGRSRRRRDRLRASPRPQDAGRHQIRQSDPRASSPSTASPITASSRASARPKARRPPARPSSSSTSPPPARRSPPTR